MSDPDRDPTMRRACPAEITFRISNRDGQGTLSVTFAFDVRRDRDSYLREIAALYPGSRALTFEVSGRNPGVILPLNSFVLA